MTKASIDSIASGLTTSLLFAFYLVNPRYKKEPHWLREQVKQRAYLAIREELLSYSNKHLD